MEWDGLVICENEHEAIPPVFGDWLRFSIPYQSTDQARSSAF